MNFKNPLPYRSDYRVELRHLCELRDQREGTGRDKQDGTDGMGLDGTNGCVHVGMPAYLRASMRARANSHAYVCIVFLGMCAFVCGCVLAYVICACIVFGGGIFVVGSPSCSSQERLSTIVQYYGTVQVLHFDRG